MCSLHSCITQWLGVRIPQSGLALSLLEKLLHWGIRLGRSGARTFRNGVHLWSWTGAEGNIRCRVNRDICHSYDIAWQWTRIVCSTYEKPFQKVYSVLLRPSLSQPFLLFQRSSWQDLTGCNGWTNEARSFWHFWRGKIRGRPVVCSFCLRSAAIQTLDCQIERQIKSVPGH